MPAKFSKHIQETTTGNRDLGNGAALGSCKSPVRDEPVSFRPLVDDAIVLTGPTASGKSSVAIALAERIGGEILSLDSIAVYTRMDIGTAKPTAEDRSRIDHHLVDLVEPNEDFSVACYLRAAHQCVQEIHARGRQVIFAGGTPMFLKGVLRGFDTGPPADWEFRESVEADLKRWGVEALRERLRQVDPLAAHRIDSHDTRRMIRALEVARSTGQPISHRQIQFDRARDANRCDVFSLQWARPLLHERINRRVDKMFTGGLIEEIERLLEKYGELSRTAAQAVGYREVIAWIREGREGDLDQVKEQVAAHTRQLARRQETWFRSFTEIHPMAGEEPFDPHAVAEKIEAEIDQRRSVPDQPSSP